MADTAPTPAHPRPPVVGPADEPHRCVSCGATITVGAQLWRDDEGRHWHISLSQCLEEARKRIAVLEHRATIAFYEAMSALYLAEPMEYRPRLRDVLYALCPDLPGEAPWLDEQRFKAAREAYLRAVTALRALAEASPEPARTFPILATTAERAELAARGMPLTVPWALVQQHEERAMLNHGQQNLATLAQRGGLCVSELVAVLENRRFQEMDAMPAVFALQRLLRGRGAR